MYLMFPGAEQISGKTIFILQVGHVPQIAKDNFKKLLISDSFQVSCV